MVSSYGGSTKSSLAQIEGFQKVQDEFGSLPYNCASLDKELKRLSDKLLSERKKYPLPNLQQNAYIEALELKKNAWESTWNTKGCRDIIENIRLESIAVAQTSSAIKAEKSILGTANKNEKIYLGLGGLVVLVGLYIVLQNR